MGWVYFGWGFLGFIFVFFFLIEIHFRKGNITSLRKTNERTTKQLISEKGRKSSLEIGKKWCQGAARAACSLRDRELGAKVTLGQPVPSLQQALSLRV